MKFDLTKHHRRSIRLRGYDYSQAGTYFVTIVTQDRANLFGAIAEGEMQLNAAGQMVECWWNELNRKFPTIETDCFVVMPNHFHGILLITENPTTSYLQTTLETTMPTLGRIMQWFKTLTTNEYMRGVKEFAWQPFNGKLWQRNYYEHIIRNEREMERITEYILSNPANWLKDDENPAR